MSEVKRRWPFPFWRRIWNLKFNVNNQSKHQNRCGFWRFWHGSYENRSNNYVEIVSIFLDFLLTFSCSFYFPLFPPQSIFVLTQESTVALRTKASVKSCRAHPCVYVKIHRMQPETWVIRRKRAFERWLQGNEKARSNGGNRLNLLIRHLALPAHSQSIGRAFFGKKWRTSWFDLYTEADLVRRSKKKTPKIPRKHWEIDSCPNKFGVTTELVAPYMTSFVCIIIELRRFFTLS